MNYINENGFVSSSMQSNLTYLFALKICKVIKKSHHSSLISDLGYSISVTIVIIFKSARNSFK